jgi:hypothetical protein
MDKSQFTPLQWLDHWAETTPNKVFLHQPVNRVVQSHTLS